MKKYKTLLIILLVFLCCLALYSMYRTINNIYNIWYEISSGWISSSRIDIMVQFVLWLLIDICGVAFSILGIVTLAKIFQDKQLFTDPEHPATPTPDETPRTSE